MNALNDFEKELYKLMINAIFGKTIENIRKRCDVKLITKWYGRYGAQALISKPEFKACTIFNENLIAVELNKTEIFFNKPIYIGMAILDIAKTSIYNFHYAIMLPKFGKNCSICYTDTDSLIYEVKNQDLYDFMSENCNKYFDTSDYPHNNIYKIPQVNKKKLGLMKDENHGSVMTEFVGLRAKMYALRVDGKDLTKRAKGIKKNIVKNKISFQDYVHCIHSSSELVVSQNLIQSKKHVVSSITQTKIALSPHDDKRFLLNKFSTLAWGNASIKPEK
jgi:hypothetical protein